MSNVLVVSCHPSATSFTAATRKAVIESATAAGHVVRHDDLHAQGFDPVLSREERRAHLAPASTKADVAPWVDNLLWCEHLVLVYPTWWAGQPAMLKGWIDRVWINEVAWTLPDGASRLKPKLRNVRRITVVTSHGSTKLVNALEGEGGKRTVTRSLRPLCHPLCRTRWIALYDIDRATPAQRDRFLARVRRSFGR
jgi:putative NADPH-quinone reductase